MRRQLSLVLSLNLILFAALPLSLPAAIAETNANPGASSKGGAGAKVKAPPNSKTPANSKAPANSKTGASAGATTAAKGLHRIDFLLEKASCATCILKVRTALRSSAGVAACEISVRKPYGAVVIFDPAKINFEKMKDVAKQADPNHHVELVDPVDKPVPGVPTLLVPLYSNLKKSS